MSAWDDLSDDELAARLAQRGLSPTSASALAAGRDRDEVAAAIDSVLEGDDA